MIDPISRIDPKHLVNLKGKMHPTYPGVLAAALEAGLRSLEVKVIQFPSADNGNCAVCEALAVFTVEGGREMTFAEIGDCDDRNCGPQIAPHKIRMAATRAKGRALRDALGIGVALREEMVNEEMVDEDSDTLRDYQPAPPEIGQVRHERPLPPSPRRGQATPPPGGNGGPATPVAPAAPAEPLAAHEGPVLKCGWRKCGTILRLDEADRSIAAFGHLVCRLHFEVARQWLENRGQPEILEDKVPDAALPETGEIVSAQAQGY